MARKLPRCEQCGKAVFPTERAARAHAAKVRKSIKRRVSVYLAPCGSWHLTSKPQQSRLRPPPAGVTAGATRPPAR